MVRLVLLLLLLLGCTQEVVEHEPRITQLMITATPEDAHIEIDGVDVGASPVHIRGEQLLGEHTLVVHRGGYAEHRETITINSGDTVEITAVLDELPKGNISLTTIPAGADVYLDEKRVGVSPVVIADIPQGMHDLRITKEGYQEYNRRIRAYQNHQSTQTITLTLE